RVTNPIPAKRATGRIQLAFMTFLRSSRPIFPAQHYPCSRTLREDKLALPNILLSRSSIFTCVPAWIPIFSLAPCKVRVSASQCLPEENGAPIKGGHHANPHRLLAGSCPEPGDDCRSGPDRGAPGHGASRPAPRRPPGMGENTSPPGGSPSRRAGSPPLPP